MKHVTATLIARFGLRYLGDQGAQLRTVDTLVSDLIDVVVRNVPSVAVRHHTNHIEFQVSVTTVATLWPFREHATLTFVEGALTEQIASTLSSQRMLVLRPRAEFDAGRVVAAFAVAAQRVSPRS